MMEQSIVEHQGLKVVETQKIVEGFDKDRVFDAALLEASIATGGDLHALKDGIELVGDDDAPLSGCLAVVRDRWVDLVGAMKASRPVPMFCHREIVRWEKVLLSCPSPYGDRGAQAHWLVLAAETAVETRKALHRKSILDTNKMPAKTRWKARKAIKHWGALTGFGE
jgi:hypothetical protein